MQDFIFSDYMLWTTHGSVKSLCMNDTNLMYYSTTHCIETYYLKSAEET